MLTVGDDALEEQGLVDYDGPSPDGSDDWWAPYPLRNVVVGETLYTVWDTGLQASSLDTLVPTGFAGHD